MLWTNLLKAYAVLDMKFLCTRVSSTIPGLWRCDAGLWRDTQLARFVCLHIARKQCDLEPSHVLWFAHILHIG